MEKGCFMSDVVVMHCRGYMSRRLRNGLSTDPLVFGRVHMTTPPSKAPSQHLTIGMHCTAYIKATSPAITHSLCTETISYAGTDYTGEFCVVLFSILCARYLGCASLGYSATCETAREHSVAKHHCSMKVYPQDECRVFDPLA